jgi:hypothetical protein
MRKRKGAREREIERGRVVAKGRKILSRTSHRSSCKNDVRNCSLLAKVFGWGITYSIVISLYLPPSPHA